LFVVFEFPPKQHEQTTEPDGVGIVVETRFVVRHQQQNDRCAKLQRQFFALIDLCIVNAPVID
jgi:hypothetical protein